MEKIEALKIVLDLAKQQNGAAPSKKTSGSRSGKQQTALQIVESMVENLSWTF